MASPVFYEIKIEGQLGDRWSSWFEGLAISTDGYGDTLLSGPLKDQAALHGVLMKIRDLGLPLISIRRMDEHTRSNE